MTRGFTLIEVLVALVIVAVGMAALMGALSSSADTVNYMRDKTFAEWVALNQLANLRLQMQPGQVPATGNTNGDLDYAGRSWHWRQEVVATQVQGMERIDVKVRPAEVKAGDDAGWFVTVSGIVGDAVAAPGSATLSWGTGVTQPGNTNGNGTLQPGSTTTPGTTTPTTQGPQPSPTPTKPLGGTSP
ncbi:MAG TPA: type II secretion system minor pseudopilin GspI [Steroidobacteraceae bacterium]|nr:type II secretion system minor pseudopilin GspI [Steroidobacteraceae bacterium]